MLKKLLKHEFKALGRYFLPMFALIILLTPVFSLLMRFGFREDALSATSIMAGFSMGTFVLMLVAMYVAVYIFIILRFYRTTATSEAYLTFTLPASPSQILWSKLVVAALYQILTFIIAVASIFATIFIAGAITPGQFGEFISQFSSVMSNYPELADTLQVSLLLFIVAFLIGLLVSTLQFYCSIMLGQLFNSHRVLISIGMYIGIYVVMQIVSLIITLPITLQNMMNTASITTTGDSTPITAIQDEMEFFHQTVNSMNSTILASCIMSVVFGVVFYVVTVMLMKKKLNVR